MGHFMEGCDFRLRRVGHSVCDILWKTVILDLGFFKDLVDMCKFLCSWLFPKNSNVIDVINFCGDSRFCEIITVLFWSNL